MTSQPLFKSVISFFIPLFLLSACATQPTINYIGNTYPPTTHVDIYAAKENIKRDNIEMGKMLLSFDEGTSNAAIHQRIIAEAEARGADAVLLQSMKLVKSGAITSWNAMGPATCGWWEAGPPFVYEGGVATTQYEEDLEVTVSLLKYNPSGTVSSAIPDMG